MELQSQIKEQLSQGLAEMEEKLMSEMEIKMHEMFREHSEEMEEEIGEKLSENYVDFNEILKSIRGQPGDPGKKGDDGYTPIKGKDYNDGKDYVLTEDDKKEIANQIKVPVIEKVVEIVKEPVVTQQITNEIKEVARYETPKQIAGKLNTLEEEVEMKVIKGLKNWMNNVKTHVVKGGGIGNFQHETKAVSSGTTSVTTSYRISGGGYAIWAFYQSANIVRGTHYTVGSDFKTLTLTFTPQDNTFIDIIYVRT